MLAGRRACVLGGAGALGNACLAFLKAAGCETTCVDYRESPSATRNLRLKVTTEWKEQANTLTSALQQQNPAGLDLLLCTAGGWTGGSIGGSRTLQSCDDMWQMNVRSAVLAAQLAAAHLKKDGLLVLTGAQAALQPTPGMLGYGMAKMATLQVGRSVANDPAVPWGCITLLPGTIDTPGNRDTMGNYLHHDWTPPEDIAQLLVQWVKDPAHRPPTGSMILLNTHEGTTTWETARLKTELELL